MGKTGQYRQIDGFKPEGGQNPRAQSGCAGKGDEISPLVTVAHGRNKRILIVDDDAGIRSALLVALSGMGYEAAAASSGSEALNVFLRNRYDLVITDLQMPGMDGWTLASLIKDRFPNIPVVLMTGQEKEDVMKDPRGNCIDCAIFKPLKLQELERELKEMFGIAQ
jgi:two-component system capsular synthesis sensor histidine kinase RcsC